MNGRRLPLLAVVLVLAACAGRQDAPVEPGDGPSDRNLSAADVAGEVAMALGADKLIFLTEQKVQDGRGRLIGSMIPREVDQLLARRKRLPEDQQRVLHNAAAACRGGVDRVHLLDRHDDGILLSELFTRDGAGTLITDTVSSSRLLT